MLTITPLLQCVNVFIAIPIAQSMDQPGMVVNPSRGQLDREKHVSPVPVRASWAASQLASPRSITMQVVASKPCSKFYG